MWMFRYENGGINGLLVALGLKAAMVDWLGNPNVVLTTILIIYIWKFAGYGGLIISGGFQGIPESQIESASIDGATLPQIYLRVLLPQVRGQVFSVAVIFLMYFLKSFDYIWPLTAGGPGWSSTVYPILVYRIMFKSYNFAQGAAAANFLFLVVALIIVPYLVRSRKRDW
jgi:ABC-type sugar transport system permease subunit